MIRVSVPPTKDVEITLDDDYLTIKGEKSEEKETSEDDRYMHERRYEKFVRRVPVPEGVIADDILAVHHPTTVPSEASFCP